MLFPYYPLFVGKLSLPPFFSPWLKGLYIFFDTPVHSGWVRQSFCKILFFIFFYLHCALSVCSSVRLTIPRVLLHLDYAPPFLQPSCNSWSDQLYSVVCSVQIQACHRYRLSYDILLKILIPGSVRVFILIVVVRHVLPSLSTISHQMPLFVAMVACSGLSSHLVVVCWVVVVLAGALLWPVVAPVLVVYHILMAVLMYSASLVLGALFISPPYSRLVVNRLFSGNSWFVLPVSLLG